MVKQSLNVSLMHRKPTGLGTKDFIVDLTV